jgi:penicillin-binding protein 2
MASGLVVAVVGVLLVAFFRVQILSSSRYQLASEQNRLRAVPLSAPRGLILDRNGVPLAENVPGYTVALLASSEDSLAAVVQRIATMVGLDLNELPAIVRRYRRSPYDPVPVLRNAPFETVSALEERRVLVPGLVIQTEPKRRYPFDLATAHVIGYVSEISEQELASGDFPQARSGTLVGRDGLERTYDARLRGKDGVRFVEVDAMGRTVRDQGVAPPLEPQPGENLQTTLDIELQRFVMEVFPAGRRGAVVVLDPRTGGILAMYSAPSYDPNEFIGGIAPELWERLSQADDHPLINRAIQAAYPPASPWKLLVAATALKRGVVGFSSRMPSPCRGGIQYYTRFFRCWKVEGHGDVTLAQAIQYSCDVYFYQLGLRLGVDKMAEYAQRFGLRARTGIELPGEKSGFYPTTQWYDKTYGRSRWGKGVRLNLAIGQGEILVTPIGLATFAAAIANGGNLYQPYVVASQVERWDGTQSVRGPGRPRPRASLGLSAATVNTLRLAMEGAVSGPRATGRLASVPGIRVAGKTGTAQNPHGQDHALFVGFAPVEAPEVAFAVVVENAGHGGSMAAPVAAAVLRSYFHVAPDTAGAVAQAGDSLDTAD